MESKAYNHRRAPDTHDVREKFADVNMQAFFWGGCEGGGKKI